MDVSWCLIGFLFLISSSCSSGKQIGKKIEREVFEPVKKIKECLKAAKAVQKNPTSVEVGTRFTIACQMFLRKMELSESQKLVLSKFGFTGSKTLSKSSNAGKQSPSNNEKRSTSKLNELPQVPEREAKSEKTFVSIDSPKPIHIDQQFINQLPEPQQLQHPFMQEHNQANFNPQLNQENQFQHIPKTSWQANPPQNIAPNIQQKPEFTQQMNFDPDETNMNSPLGKNPQFQDPNFQDVVPVFQPVNTFQPNPQLQFKPPSTNSFVPPHNEFQDHQFQRLPEDHQFRMGPNNGDLNNPPEAQVQQDVYPTFDNFQRFPRRYDEL